MEIEVKKLAEQFRRSEEEPFEDVYVSPYVMEHIFKPLLRDERLHFADLDFSRFDQEDLTDLCNYVGKRDSYHENLCSLNAIFCAAVPTSARTRAFC